MLEKILIFVIFLAPLIFFHELGHFFFARFFGVRVEVFSIGFGPKIFKYVRKGTEYAISIIPLGGYVKMFGDDPFSEVPLSDEEKKVAFNYKSKWARFWIVFGGPFANLLLAYFLYVGLLAGGEKVPETKLGLVAPTSVLYEKGFRTGDTLVGINDEKILSFDDLNIKGSRVEKVFVKRKDQQIPLNVDMNLEKFVNEFVHVISVLKKPIFINKDGERFYLSLSPDLVNSDLSLEEMLSDYAGEAYLSKFTQKDDLISLDSNSKIKLPSSSDLLSDVIKSGFYPVDLTVKNIVMGSPADKAGIRKDDILVSVADSQLLNFEQLRQKLQTIEDNQEVEVKILSKGELLIKKIIPEVKVVDKKKTKLIGIESGVEYIQPKLIIAKSDSFGSAIVGAFERTWDGIVKTFSGYKKLITREVSLNNIGGPLAIGKVASDSLNVSLSMFFRLMAIISINLGVINLFPIPVLDGGHIMFLIFEIVNRGPLSRRKLEIAQRLGMSILFFLIFIALFNDITRLF
ncbi:MAG: RIP metalloprotease RseP [Bacteriovoracaceae bacterium]